MEPLRHILVASDLSVRSDRALARAARLAASLRVERLTLLHVQEEYPPGPRLSHLARAVVERTLRERLDRLDLPAGLARAIVVASGKPFVEIIRRARELGADLIVVGAQGAGFFRGLLLGTTAEKIVRKGDRSVLIVKQAARRAYRTLVVAVDLSPASRDALQFALALAPDATCHVLHVHPGLPESRLALLAPSREDSVRYRRGEKAAAARALERFLAPLALSGRRIRTTVRVGRVAEQVLEIVQHAGADLVAIGATGRSGLPFILLGSTAEHVMREAPCDVLAVRTTAPQFALP